MTTNFAILFASALTVSSSLMLALLYNHRRQNKAEKILASFSDAATEFNLSISKLEILKNRVIGFDDVNNKLLFLEAIGNKQDGYLIDLEEVEICTLKSEYGNIYNNRASNRSLEAHLNAIALEFNYKNEAPPTVLPFYDSKTNPAIERRARAEQAKKWQTFLSTTLTSKAPVSQSGREVALGI